mgnify:FL=1
MAELMYCLLKKLRLVKTWQQVWPGTKQCYQTCASVNEIGGRYAASQLYQQNFVTLDL